MKYLTIILIILITLSCNKEQVILPITNAVNDFAVLEVINDDLDLDLEVCDEINFSEQPDMLQTTPNSWWKIQANDKIVHFNYWDGGSGTVQFPQYPDYNYSYGGTIQGDNDYWSHVVLKGTQDTISFFKTIMNSNGHYIRTDTTLVRVQNFHCIK